jgi:hypothetical protein
MLKTAKAMQGSCADMKWGVSALLRSRNRSQPDFRYIRPLMEISSPGHDEFRAGLIEIPAASTRVLGVCGMKAEPQSSSRHAPQDEFLNEDNQDHRSAEEWEI